MCHISAYLSKNRKLHHIITIFLIMALKHCHSNRNWTTVFFVHSKSTHHSSSDLCTGSLWLPDSGSKLSHWPAEIPEHLHRSTVCLAHWACEQCLVFSSVVPLWWIGYFKLYCNIHSSCGTYWLSILLALHLTYELLWIKHLTNDLKCSYRVSTQGESVLAKEKRECYTAQEEQ